jgi:hypothetical protein
MGQAIPSRHPAVVLRSHYTLVRSLLAVAMIAVIGLSIAVVLVATEDDTSSIATPVVVSAPGPDGIRFDGGPEEGTSGVRAAPLPVTRYDGGPEEGSSGWLFANQAESATPGVRYDGGPEEGTAGIGR